MFTTLTRAEAVTEFDQAVREVPHLIESQRLFGDPDYLLRVVAADLPYQELYEQTLAHVPGVQGLRSTIVMKHAVPARPLPISP